MRINSVKPTEKDNCVEKVLKLVKKFDFINLALRN